MHDKLKIPPPADVLSFSPSELFKFFFQLGRWTEDSFSANFQNYTRGKLISTVTINKWKNKDVIPTRYSGALLKMIEDQFEASIAKDWSIAFETVWATHIARSNKGDQKTSSKIASSDMICRQHKNWIAMQYEKKLHEDQYSAADIYVPLQFIDIQKEHETLYDTEDLLANLAIPNRTQNKIDWTFISGGPGSGKSITAIHLAFELAKTSIFPIYLRGSHLSEIDIDIRTASQPVIDSFSVKSFLQHFRASSRQAACLVLDGIDEISDAALGSKSALSQILNDLGLEQNVCRAHGKNLSVIILGRPSHIDYARRQVPSESSKCLEMLALDGSHQQSSTRTVIGQDLRAKWWENYLAATGRKADPILPNFLSTDYDDYTEFGSEPLLTSLICRAALTSNNNSSTNTLAHEAVNELTSAKNKNQIYGDIIKHIHSRAPLQHKQKLEFSGFLSVLQHIALANWHTGDDRSVLLQNVRNSFEDKSTELAFQALNLASPDMLITAFYYRISKEDTSENQASIEFTHKSFSEYLVSTAILDRFLQLISAFETRENLEHALANWAKVSCAGTHTPNLAEFCQKEASLRYDDFSHLNWDLAFTLISDHLIVTPINAVDGITKTQHSASLLLYIWSCLNIERQRRTGENFNLFEGPDRFNTLTLKSIQLPNVLHFDTASPLEPELRSQTFLTPSLSALNLQSTDMSQLNFSIGHMHDINCRESNFAMTHWSHVKVSASLFHKSIFQHAIFHGGRWSNTQFSNCLFQAVKFQFSNFTNCRLKNSFFSQCHFSDVEILSTEMEGIIFDRCTFAQCHFNSSAEIGPSNSAIFRYCTFLEMDESLLKNMPFAFENCIFQTKHIDPLNINKNEIFGSQIGELLL